MASAAPRDPPRHPARLRRRRAQPCRGANRFRRQPPSDPSPRGVSLSVNRGEIVAILGANGAGKTTLLNAISGVLPIAAGRIEFAEKRIDGRKPWTLSRAGISHVPEGREIFPSMTVEANLKIVDAFGSGPVFSVEDVLNMFPRLRERYRQAAGNLSGGEQQMLAIGRGLMARPRLILFDEPSLGLSPFFSKFVLGAIGASRRFWSNRTCVRRLRLLIAPMC